MLLIYCPPDEEVLLARVRAAYPGKAVTVRNPALFRAFDADLLDKIVYCQDTAFDIKDAYARFLQGPGFPRLVVLSLDQSPLPMAPDDLIATVPDDPNAPPPPPPPPPVAEQTPAAPKRGPGRPPSAPSVTQLTQESTP
jgi:hypothetical protein